MEALFSGKSCFLDGEGWRDLALQPSDHTISTQYYLQTVEFARCLAACSGLAKKAYAIGSATPKRVSSLAQRTLKLRDRLSQWFEGFTLFAPPPKEVPSAVQDSLYPVVYHYCNSCSAIAFCGYYATVIILHRILIECKYHADFSDEISESVDKIWRSIEYLSGTGILGPYRLGFSIRVAFEVVPLTTKLWIRKWL